MDKEVKGTIARIEEKREGNYPEIGVVVTVVNGEYSDNYRVIFREKNFDKLNGINVGDEVIIQTNITGRDYTDKNGVIRNFMNFIGWKIEVTKKLEF